MNKFRSKLLLISRRIINWLASPIAQAINVLIIIIWFVTGLINGFSDTHQLTINTGTTIYNFLVSGAILLTQKQDSKAIHIKLDELISLSSDKPSARNELIAIEEETEEALEEIAEGLRAIKKEALGE